MYIFLYFRLGCLYVIKKTSPLIINGPIISFFPSAKYFFFGLCITIPGLEGMNHTCLYN